MRSAGKTDVGLVRKINEDSFICVNLAKELSITAHDIYLYIVADGMGGRNAGEIASNMAITEAAEFIKENICSSIKKEDCEKEIHSMLDNAILHTNDKVYKKSVTDSECFGMGTTLSLALVIDNNIYLAHIGDSRIYMIRNNNIVKLTDDHSLVAELVKNGTIKPEDANSHPQKHIITRALGTEYSVKADNNQFSIFKNDYLILCTDGLSNLVEDKEIMDTILDSDNLEKACDSLIDLAKSRGGQDNITVVLIQIGEGGENDDR